ncbi:hypothetical protein Desca_0437 [Desulfotomaculum nigrificans CO-1-SRB]|uniref:Uncharacterized protein n=1 Tax=Desulfotomaculum nigrificans (strain DSM 14880 / VKM B-2319 / CO-1-SRB) TaxID=868595 RepID=F6B780_DESCC|nr:hypothetical protein Desca_0437 [Desulfotomaculum nigrificans CO-1-SRB]
MLRKIKRNIERKTVDQVRKDNFQEANQGFKKILIAISGGLLLLTGIIFAAQI